MDDRCEACGSELGEGVDCDDCLFDRYGDLLTADQMRALDLRVARHVALCDQYLAELRGHGPDETCSGLLMGGRGS